MNDDEIIAVVQAHKEGKQIQRKCNLIFPYRSSVWEDMHEPMWDFTTSIYRVKPEAREWWLGKLLNFPYMTGPFDSRESLLKHSDSFPCYPVEEVIHVREVIE